MKNCPNCHHQAKDEALFCPVCGTTLDAFIQPDVEYFQKEVPVQSVQPQLPVTRDIPNYDHTADFVTEDIHYSKLACMGVYLLSVIGIIIALLMSGSSEYTQFHIRQGLKITIVEALILLACSLFCWTFIIPILGLIAMAVLLIIRFLCFLSVCKGKAIDAPIIRNISFLN